jgi:plasmid stabilization system protein ParE
MHPQAAEEAAAAREWYAARSERAAERFVAELDDAMEHIIDSPNQWPPYLRGTRQYTLRHFPYLVVYQATETTVRIIAVAHGRRKPGYWKSRTPTEDPA